MQNKSEVPASLAIAETQFSSMLRSQYVDKNISSHGLLLYRDIIRGNIHRVLQNAFPFFCIRSSDFQLSTLVDDFIFLHHASQPEFHQIATELLLFIRNQGNLSACDLALLEYEWLIYSIEIDDSTVPKPQEITITVDDMHQIKIIPNPTLKLVSLPFKIIDGEPYYHDGSLSHYYAIYRKYNGELYQKCLGHIDLFLLLKFKGKPISADALLSALSEVYYKICNNHFQEDPPPSYSCTYLQSWLNISNNDGIISLEKR